MNRSRTMVALVIGTISPRGHSARTTVCRLVCVVHCLLLCISSFAACPTGSVVSTDTSSSQITTCAVVGAEGAASGGCPSGYTCYNSQLLGQNVCCGAVRSGLFACVTSIVHVLFGRTLPGGEHAFRLGVDAATTAMHT